MFDHVISLKNLFLAWQEFKRGKTGKLDVLEFAFSVENNIFRLHNELEQKIWKPDSYIAFYVRDPKLRHIHKATIRDRTFNQALFRILYQIFDIRFITDSYSCREGKGTHRGVLKLQSYIRRVTRNYSRPAFALKCDVRKFFDNIDHSILFNLIKKRINDSDVLSIINLIIRSFETNPGKGLPLGNVTSQLFANIYLNELDQFIKHVLKVKYYLRYCDDFIILEQNQDLLKEYIKRIGIFLQEKLYLQLHPNKVNIRKCTQGIDFLGYVVLPDHVVLRTKTKERIIRKIIFLKEQLDKGFIIQETFDQTLQSYLGILKHCNGYKIQQEILDLAYSDLKSNVIFNP
ncbi:MAG: reverse transcriptase domain-containing protein [Candidatus Taylorbacteria bacterium]|nr:reverse transcriptase domain-containing protein [Candidatus Taylorbacteria bacterium]